MQKRRFSLKGFRFTKDKGSNQAISGPTAAAHPNPTEGAGIFLASSGIPTMSMDVGRQGMFADGAEVQYGGAALPYNQELDRLKETLERVHVEQAAAGEGDTSDFFSSDEEAAVGANHASIASV